MNMDLAEILELLEILDILSSFDIITKTFTKIFDVSSRFQPWGKEDHTVINDFEEQQHLSKLPWKSPQKSLSRQSSSWFNVFNFYCILILLYISVFNEVQTNWPVFNDRDGSKNWCMQNLNYLISFRLDWTHWIITYFYLLH